MGTNFYTEPLPPCESCGRPWEGLHLGKSSAGWSITLQANGYKYYQNWDEMKAWLQDKVIKDEYDGPCSVADFIDMVEKRKNIPDPEPVDYGPSMKIIGGYKFYNCEFS
jgi:hypothetical protein